MPPPVPYSLKVSLAALLALAGCLNPSMEPPATPAGEPLPPLPEPASNNPANNIGGHALQDPTYENATTGPLPWRNECIRQWRSGHYDFGNPPIVKGQACLFFPTADGTLYWHLAAAQRNSRGDVPTLRAAALARPDGFFDWVYLASGTKDLVYQENGTTPPQVVAQDLPIAMKDEVRDEAISAVRTNDGTIHVGLHDRGDGNTTSLGGTLHHVWWKPGGQAQVESLEGGGWFDVPALRTDGSRVFAFAPQLEASILYVSDGGAFTAIPFPGRAYDVAAGTDGGYYCASLGASWVVVHVPTGESAVPTVIPVTASPVAPISFYCAVEPTPQGLVMVFPGGPAPLIGGGPNPAEASETVGTYDGTTWTFSSLGWTSGYGEEDLTWGLGRPVFMAATGNGTTSSNPRDMNQLRAPPSIARMEEHWPRVWGNALGTTWFLDDPYGDRVLVMADSAVNPPFRFPHPWSTTTWGVLDVTLPSLE